MRSPSPITLAGLLLVALFTLLADSTAQTPRKKYRNFNLPCLAPLLRDSDSESPVMIDEAFLAAPATAARQLEGIGKVDFPITIATPEGQMFFNQGIAFLHGLAYKEAERNFRQAHLFDEHNPIVYWGLALANEQRPGRARLFAQEAIRRIRNETSARERLWINTLARFHNVQRNGPAKLPPPEKLTDEEFRERHQQRIRDLEAIAFDFPEDVEAKAFLVRQLVLDEYRVGLPITSHLAVESLAREVAAAAPEHPSRHYRIFLWLGERPENALPPAADSASLAPAIADSWRYTAEAWRANGNHHQAIPFLDAALRVDHRHIHDHLLMPGDTQNLASNYAALIDALGTMGRIEDALLWARRMIDLPRNLNAAADSSARYVASFSTIGKRLHAETLLRAEFFERLLHELENSPALQPDKNSHHERGRALYFKGIALASLERFDEIDPLEDQLQALADSTPSTVLRNSTLGLLSGLETYRSLCSKDIPNDPSIVPPLIPANILARAWALAGFNEEALEITRRDLTEHPGQLFSAAANCEIHFIAGQKVPAMSRLNRAFRADAFAADPGLPAIARLDPIAREMNLPGRWTLPPAPLENPSLPADLDSLGPAAWTAPAAPAWTLPNHVNRDVSLADFDGKPVLLNFFLGVGCVFCAEQLGEFRPHIPAFDRAGINMIAISSDTPADLALALGDTEEKTPEAREQFPYPILADPDLALFKAYGAYDDFEDGPTHGTILIDGQGRILWKDISHAPFSKPEALLAEAQRLLEIHSAEK